LATVEQDLLTTAQSQTEFLQLRQHFAKVVNSKYIDHFDNIQSVVGDSLQHSQARKSAVVAQEAPGHVRHPLVFVFGGQGPQHYEMGRALFKAYPVFRRVIQRCDEVYTKLTGVSLI
jgi:acyl transferase domain-containing protein